MTPFRWILAAVSFAAAIAVSLYIVRSSWPAENAAVSVSPLVHAALLALALLELGARGLKVRLSAAALAIPMTYGAAARVSRRRRVTTIGRATSRVPIRRGAR